MSPLNELIAIDVTCNRFYLTCAPRASSRG